VENFLTSLIR